MVFTSGKSKRRLHDRKTEYLKAFAKNDNTSAIAGQVKTTVHNIKWDHFDILVSREIRTTIQNASRIILFTALNSKLLSHPSWYK